MIDDGYTQHWNGFWYRPLGPEGRGEVRRLAWSENALAEWLWRPPRFWGPWRDLTTEEQKQMFDRMVDDSTEREDADNLHDGVDLWLRDPRLSLRTCDLCLKWWFDQETGLVCTGQDGDLLRRPEYAVPSCETGIGCGKHHHSEELSLSARNQQALTHWLEWRHTGLPDSHRECAIVRRNWQIIGELVEQHGLQRLRTAVHVRTGDSGSIVGDGRGRPEPASGVTRSSDGLAVV